MGSEYMFFTIVARQPGPAEDWVQKFPDDTQDSVERLYAQTVLRHFPNYGRFWEQFIGQRADPASGILRPYGIAYPESIDAKTRNRYDNEYELMRMQHYSIFVHIAGAHYQAKELERSLKLKEVCTRHFRHWECYDVGLLHLSTAISLGKGLVTQIDRLTDQQRLLNDLLNHDLWGELNLAVRSPRNDAVHYSRRLHRSNASTGDFEVLREPYYQRRRAWSQDLTLVQDDSKWIKAGDKLRKDIIGTETLLNDAWGWMIEALSRHFATLGLSVRYSAPQDTAPSPPNASSPAVDTARPQASCQQDESSLVN